MKMDTRKPSLRKMMNSESKNSMKNDLKVRIVTVPQLTLIDHRYLRFQLPNQTHYQLPNAILTNQTQY